MPVLSISPFFLFGLLSLCSFVSSFSSVFPTFFFCSFYEIRKEKQKKNQDERNGNDVFVFDCAFFFRLVWCVFL